ncbi:MAG: hypothetical protein EOQ64_01475 [Mesorhizobium sp.]|uniref:hypothetical protein n=1 Tax=Mesorhizobium sp. TaxID=1871066 RepID=UPI000FE8EDA3|nr:hypothetical protein [Mesorhizobium sp.]RWG60476.1 MAG: hypothetical protein EOQ64_01475 [Mesorhizobium sp.]RWH46455.1 MAG: hypothetical protein EOQ78_03230 [Mesorhizobium sp.]
MHIANAAKARFRANRTGKMKVGRCILAEKPRPSAPFQVTSLRLRELERIITNRFGVVLPETDDADIFIEVAAYALNARCHQDGLDLDPVLTGWCARWAPWALPRAGTVIRPILNKLVGRKYDMKADDVARRLLISMWERTAFELRTIGAHDIPTRVRKGIAKSVKRSNDRARQTAKRRAKGVQPRESWLAAHSLSKARPWDAEGISRAQWYRRHGETGPSLVGRTTKSDTLVSSVPAVPLQEAPSWGPSSLTLAEKSFVKTPEGPPSGRNAAVVLGTSGVVVALSSKQHSSLQSRHGAVNADGGTEQCDVEEGLRQMGVAS